MTDTTLDTTLGTEIPATVFSNFYQPENTLQGLTNNIYLLTSLHYQNFYQMNEELAKLRRERTSLETQVQGQKRRIHELEDKLDSALPPAKRAKRGEESNKYAFVPYRRNRASLADDALAEVFSGLRTIKDIIALKSRWMSIRHDERLQRLSNTIPALERLDRMIGLTDIKRDLFKVLLYYVQNEHRDEYLHTIITGPPGVGKTEFARIYADIFVRLGVLESDVFVEAKRDDFVGKYVGHTAPKTRALLDSAMGGVLFLDEAYSLGEREQRDSFAKEAIDMINQYLSERKGDFMFIIAGYESDLDACFFAFNKGLRRRFSHTFHIEKYNEAELAGIARQKLIQAGFVVSEKELSATDFDRFFRDNYKRFVNYAGDIERLVNYVKYEQSYRTFQQGRRSRRVVMEDLVAALACLRAPKEDREPPFGMYL